MLFKNPLNNGLDPNDVFQNLGFDFQLLQFPHFPKAVALFLLLQNDASL